MTTEDFPHRTAAQAKPTITVTVGAGALAAVAITIVAVVLLRASPSGTGNRPLPTGLFVPNQPLEMCVAIELGSDAVSRGKATIFWWSVASPDCSNRYSGITSQAADLKPVSLPAVDRLPVRTGYEVSFGVSSLPSGNPREISFTLDPDFAGRNGLALAALRQGEAIPTVTFTRVDRLAIPGPEDWGPVPTPDRPSPAP